MQCQSVAGNVALVQSKRSSECSQLCVVAEAEVGLRESLLDNQLSSIQW